MQRVPPREVTCAAGFEATVGRDLDTADAGALLRRQRLHARLHRLGARRVRHPRRGDRRLPAGRRGAGAAGPVRRHAGIDPRLRSGDPALDQAAARRSTCCRCQRGPAGRRQPSPASAPAIWRPFGAPGDDPLYAAVSEGGAARGHGALAAAVLPNGWRPCSTTCRTTRLIALDHLAARRATSGWP